MVGSTQRSGALWWSSPELPWLFSFLSSEGLVEFALLDQNGLKSGTKMPISGAIVGYGGLIIHFHSGCSPINYENHPAIGVPPIFWKPPRNTLWWTNRAMEHGWFIVGLPCKKWWFSIAILVYQREIPMRRNTTQNWGLKMNTSNTRLGCTEGHFRAIGWIWLMYAAIITNIHQDWEETIFMYL